MKSQLIYTFVVMISLVKSAPSDIFEKESYEKNEENNRNSRQIETSEISNLEYDDTEPLSSSEVDPRSLFGNIPGRKRRWYTNWGYQYQNGQLLGYDGSLRWKPQPIQISPPYVIPVFGGGTDRRKYIYFPPQPIEVYNIKPNPINSGSPPDNPLKPPFAAPTYLPPTTKKPLLPANFTNIRFDQYDDNMPIWSVVQDDRTIPPPVWGMAPTQRPQRPTSRPSTRPPSSNAIPTRPPRPPITDNSRLIHDIGSGTNQLSAFDEPEFQRFPERPTTSNRPRPPATTTPRPRPSTTTFRPNNQLEPNSQPGSAGNQLGPSNCVWAVISCCSASTNIVPEGCFEQRGCAGPFWDKSPCDSEFADSAIQRALEFYRPRRKS